MLIEPAQAQPELQRPRPALNRRVVGIGERVIERERRRKRPANELGAFYFLSSQNTLLQNRLALNARQVVAAADLLLQVVPHILRQTQMLRQSGEEFLDLSQLPCHGANSSIRT